MNKCITALDQIRGSHHCIGTSRIILDAIFGVIHSRAIAFGGTITVKEILDAKAQFIESLPSGIDLFEKINRECMEASNSTAPDLFSRDMILATLLSACGEGSAEYAFKLQIQQCGMRWMNYFFEGMAQAVGKNISQEERGQLIDAFVHAAEKHKANMQVSDLVHRKDVQEILLECIAPFSRTVEIDEIVKATSAEINNYICTKYKIRGPHIARITDDQMKRYLTMLPNEFYVTFSPHARSNQLSEAS